MKYQVVIGNTSRELSRNDGLGTDLNLLWLIKSQEWQVVEEPAYIVQSFAADKGLVEEEQV